MITEMRNLTRKFALVGALALGAVFGGVGSPVAAQDSAEDRAAASAAIIAIAEDYLAAYETFTPSNMEPFLAEDAVFFDPTWNEDRKGVGLRLEGKVAIIEGLSDVAARYTSFSLSYDVTRRYEANGVVVFIADLTYRGESKKGNKFEGTAPIVTTVTVRDGKIAMHKDYFDYATNAIDPREEFGRVVWAIKPAGASPRASRPLGIDQA